MASKVSGAESRHHGQQNCGCGLGADGAEPPAHLDALAQEFWRRNITAIRSPLDLDTYSLLCQMYSWIQQADSQRVRVELLAKYTMLARQFGLTPQSRRTLGTPSQAARFDGKGQVNDEDFEIS